MEITIGAPVVAGGIAGTCIASAGNGAVCLQGTAGGDDAVLAKNGVKARFLSAAEYKPEGNTQTTGSALNNT